MHLYKHWTYKRTLDTKHQELSTLSVYDHLAYILYTYLSVYACVMCTSKRFGPDAKIVSPVYTDASTSGCGCVCGGMGEKHHYHFVRGVITFSSNPFACNASSLSIRKCSSGKNIFGIADRNHIWWEQYLGKSLLLSHSHPPANTHTPNKFSKACNKSKQKKLYKPQNCILT